VDTWKTLKDIQYERVNSPMITSKVKDDRAVGIAEAKIKAAAVEATQRQIYYLVRVREQWLIDELIVTDEEAGLNTIRL
jgi:hypothetical protein